jgi:hypothetical protein
VATLYNSVAPENKYELRISSSKNGIISIELSDNLEEAKRFKVRFSHRVIVIVE